MPFTGPDHIYGLGPGGDFELEQRYRQQQFSNALELARFAQDSARSTAASASAATARLDATDAGRARLAMTPGVTGPGSPAAYSVADSPDLQTPPQHFSEFGQEYSYSPDTAAASAGHAQATEEDIANRTRMSDLQNIPGITPRMASRMVYGRSGVMDDEDPSAMRTALANYVRQPSRETQAAAMQVGASLNQFPSLDQYDPRTGNLVVRPKAPVEGTPEYYTMVQRDAEIRAKSTQDTQRLAIGERADVAARRPVSAAATAQRQKAADDVYVKYNFDTAQATASPEAQRLGLTDDDFARAEGRHSASRAAAIQHLLQTGAAASVDEAAKILDAARAASRPASPASPAPDE